MTITYYKIEVYVFLGKHFDPCVCDTDCIVTEIQRHDEWRMRIKNSCGRWCYLPYDGKVCSIGETTKRG